MRTPGGWALAAFALVLPAGCRHTPDRPGATARPAAATHPPGASPAAPRLPGMPPPLRPGDGYAADRVVRRFRVGRLPQHVTPSWDLRRLWVANDESTVSRSMRLRHALPVPLALRPGAKPQDVKLAPDGRLFYVAGGVWLVDGARLRVTGFVATGAGAHGLEVYAIDTRSGRLLARVRVGRSPHGLCVYPQPGRYSLGHTGVFR